MSDCLEICFLITDNGVSTGISCSGVVLYSLSGDPIVLTGFISKSGCFSVSLCKAVCAGVNLWVLKNIFLSVILIRSPV